MKLKPLLAGVALATLIGGAAMAQSTTTKPAAGEPGTTVTTGTTKAPATTTTGTQVDTKSKSDATGSNSSGTTNDDENPPVAGANSFTEGQAKARLEDHGYSGISPLQKDDQSIWRGTAMKNGKKVGVAVDYKGNVTEAP
jgi:hypothetical protein